MTDGLKPQYRRAIIETLSANPKVERVVLFGSRAMGTFTPTSDIDLALFGGDLTLSDQAALTEAMAELAIPQRVDILIHHRVENQALREHIRKHGVEWFARKRATGKLATAELRPSCASNKRKAPMSTPPSAPTARNSGMTGEWRQYSVSDLIERGALVIGDGYRAKNEELSHSGLPFARARNINGGFRFDDADRFPEANIERVENKVSQPGDVVFTSKGTVGRFAFVRHTTPRFVYSPQLCFWRSLDWKLIDPRFLFFWMNGREFFVQFKGVSAQTDMAEYVSLTDQRRMHMTLPPLSEQRAIAHILGTLDDKIELNRRMSETLEAMARALFKSWFVDFDPVRAKAGGRDPGLPDEIAKLFPDALTEHPELGEIPDGWEVRPLPEVVAVNPTRSLRKGEVAHFLKPDQVGWGSTEYIVLRALPPWPPEFAYCLARSTAFRDFAIQSMTRSSGRQRVPADSLSHFRLVVAPMPVAELFGSLVQPAFARASAAARESRTLAALRDALLPKLISGEPRVKDAERFLKERGL